MAHMLIMDVVHEFRSFSQGLLPTSALLDRCIEVGLLSARIIRKFQGPHGSVVKNRDPRTPVKTSI